MTKGFRPPAVPLVTVDPYFSVWSGADNLYDDDTRHWTGKRNGMVGMACIDGKVWRFLGKTEISENTANPYFTRKEPPGMEQLQVEVRPLSSLYIFKAGGVCLEVEFTTPLLMDDLDLLSRPASYISFKVYAIDGCEHEVKLYFDVTAEWCVDVPGAHDQHVVWQRKFLNDTVEDLYMGTLRQNVLGKCGDSVRIDWGYFHLVLPSSDNKQGYISSHQLRKAFIKGSMGSVDNDYGSGGDLIGDMPVMAVVADMKIIGEKPSSDFIILAYDDIYAFEYFKENLPAYWRRDGLSFDGMLLKAIDEFSAVREKCRCFEKELILKGIEAGGEKYAQILALAYRQAIAAHKLAADSEGNILFISKECFSNGCAATVDVSYPSIPLFLLYNPELVKGMLRPIFKYIASGDWQYDFAPHDAGRFPNVNGQVYRLKREWGPKGYAIDMDGSVAEQMPIEECGNMLIIAAALCMVEKDTSFVSEHWDLLTKWAQYLAKNGFDPGEQLSTDDFTSKLAHNANLSVKAVMGIASYAFMCGMMGNTEKSEEYKRLAKDMAVKWEEIAGEGDHYRLTFTGEGTWSLKYNMVWDDIFDFGLFPADVKEREIAYYIKMKNRYGTPLDSRDSLTKSDWLVWSAALAGNNEDFMALVEPLWDFLNESPSRVPFTDFYGTTDRHERSMHHRSVVGGVFIKLLKDKYHAV